MGNFYSRLSYSFGNEDSDTEHKALKIKPTDKVLCVTASGDRPLNLLTKEVKEIVTIDANPLQNALFDIKKTAMKKLSYPEYLEFIGAEPSCERLKVYERLDPFLEELTSRLWRQHSKKVKRGLLYAGSVERCCKMASTFLRKVRGNKIQKLFSFDNLENQRNFLKTEWHTFLWKKTFDIFLHPSFSRMFIKDPGLYSYLDPNIHVGRYLYDRLHGSLDHVLARESVLISLLLKGEVEKKFFPPYLSETGVAMIKKRLDRIRFHTADIVSFLEKSEDRSFDCFSISDVASYLDKSAFSRLIKAIHRTAKPGARFCIRQFLSNHQIPEALISSFKRDKSLEKTLEKEDRCLVYHFMVGEIQK